MPESEVWSGSGGWGEGGGGCGGGGVLRLSGACLFLHIAPGVSMLLDQLGLKTKQTTQQQQKRGAGGGGRGGGISYAFTVYRR